MNGDVYLPDELYDPSKTRELVLEIQESEIDERAKQFLMAAANRHTVFNYKRIAEYYANADREVQTLMEKSALVIVDYDNAIANGFSNL